MSSRYYMPPKVDPLLAHGAPQDSCYPTVSWTLHELSWGICSGEVVLELCMWRVDKMFTSVYVKVGEQSGCVLLLRRSRQLQDVPLQGLGSCLTSKT